MKFTQDLDQQLVPEWRAKYFDYRAGKKHIKAVTKAISRANASTFPGRPSRPRASSPPPSDRPFTLVRRTSLAAARKGPLGLAASPASPGASASQPALEPTPPTSSNPDLEPPAPAIGISHTQSQARTLPPSVKRSSISVNVAPEQAFTSPPPLRHRPALTSPLYQRPFEGASSAGPGGWDAPGNDMRRPSLSRRALTNFFSSSSQLSRNITNNTLSNGNGPANTKAESVRQTLEAVRERERQFFAFLDGELDKIETFYLQKEQQATARLEILRQQLHEMRAQRVTDITECREWNQQQKQHRQSHHQRTAENTVHAAEGSDEDQHNSYNDTSPGGDEEGNQPSHRGPFRRNLMDPLKPKFFELSPVSQAFQSPISQSFQSMASTPVLATRPDILNSPQRDYERRPHKQEVPYRTAKRKLKLAVQELYRGLDLLKSYALLNQTAFRKLNKKYDKATGARPPLRYMSDKVNSSAFVTSNVPDGHMSTVEGLYARYFEKGNHKIAAGKLRKLSRAPSDASASTFCSGLLAGVGAVFAVQGLVLGAELLFDDDATLRLRTSYLLQIYGGYFLVLYMFALFCLNCSVWTANKVNYAFVFEFNPCSHMGWNRLAEFPALFFALFGVLMWLNFSRFGVDWEAMYLWYPVVLVGLSLAILLFPAPMLHYKGRIWLLYSHYRLLFAGLYPVEFRDFFLGDIWSSLTYTTSNVELFFCLYSRSWDSPQQCNSNHSRLMGFLATLPAIWRVLQCIRRYWDTRNVFPHLVNCGKYAMTILSAVLLSLYRIEDSTTNFVLFVTFSALTSIYTSVWDLFMDFSLLQSHTRHRLLRDITTFNPVWTYYVVMAADPALRFLWIFYAIFAHDAQHSSVVSFLVALGEVTRRASWAIFRVENEHCANVAQHKASRDVPLPYQYLLEERTASPVRTGEAAGARRPPHLSPFVERPSVEAAVGMGMEGGADSKRTPTTESGQDAGAEASESRLGIAEPGTPAAPSQDASSQTQTQQQQQAGLVADESGLGGEPPSPWPAAAGGLRRRRAGTGASEKKSILQIMSEAHKQDFEKRRPPAGDAGGMSGGFMNDSESDDEDDEEGDTEEDMEVLRMASTASGSGSGAASSSAAGETEMGAAVARVGAGEEAGAASSRPSGNGRQETDGEGPSCVRE